MLTILPIKEKGRLQEICKEVPGAENTVDVLLMKDEEEELGYVVVDIKASVLRMISMKVPGEEFKEPLTTEQRFCADSLMRAAASYGANNGAYKIESHIPQINHMLQGLGWVLEGNIAFTELKNIVKFVKK